MPGKCSVLSHATTVSLGLSSPCKASVEGMPPSGLSLSALLNICSVICHIIAVIWSLADTRALSKQKAVQQGPKTGHKVETEKVTL